MIEVSWTGCTPRARQPVLEVTYANGDKEIMYFLGLQPVR